MKIKKPHFVKLLRIFLTGFVLLIAVVIVMISGREKTVHAFPEYASYTGEACGVCHVNPGGGGPRTIRGLLWAAQGRPEDVPELGDVLLAPLVNDGAELYEIACGGCHGYRLEGLFAMGLAGTELSEVTIRSFILRGIPQLGMPGFEGQFTDAQLDLLLEYMNGIVSGEIQPEPESYPLAPVEVKCLTNFDRERCGGN